MAAWLCLGLVLQPAESPIRQDTEARLNAPPWEGPLEQPGPTHRHHPDRSGQAGQSLGGNTSLAMDLWAQLLVFTNPHTTRNSGRCPS